MSPTRSYAGALSAVFALAAWCFVRSASEPVARELSLTGGPLALASARQATVARDESAAARAPRGETALASAGAGTPEQADEQTTGSHPIAPMHEHMRYTQQLLGALNDALDQSDPVRMRDLIDRYDEAEPDDTQQLREGYERIADCLQARDAQARTDTRANAQRYYDQARASTLRRSVRRHCLER